MGTVDNHLRDFLTSDSRSWPRTKCNYTTECADESGNRWICKVIDLSFRGLGIISTTRIREGERLSIAEPRIRASVVWVEDGRAGLKIFA
jgi:hypothetical protein